MTEAEIAAVAGRLSEAQKRALTWDWTKNHSQWAKMISCWGDEDLANSLYDLRLTENHTTLTPLTPLGLAVRAHLQGQATTPNDSPAKGGDEGRTT